MEEDTRSAMTKLEWGVVFSVLVSSASIVFSAGVIWTKVLSHEVAIQALQASNTSQIDRLARIETKLDLLLTERRNAP